MIRGQAVEHETDLAPIPHFLGWGLLAVLIVFPVGGCAALWMLIS